VRRAEVEVGGGIRPTTNVGAGHQLMESLSQSTQHQGNYVMEQGLGTIQSTSIPKCRQGRRALAQFQDGQAWPL